MKNCITPHEPGIYCNWFNVIAEYRGKVHIVRLHKRQASTYSEAVRYMSEHRPEHRCIRIESAKPMPPELSLAC